MGRFSAMVRRAILIKTGNPAQIIFNVLIMPMWFCFDLLIFTRLMPIAIHDSIETKTTQTAWFSTTGDIWRYDNTVRCPPDDYIKTGFVALQIVTDEVLISHRVPGALAAAGGLLRDLNLTHLPLAASAVLISHRVPGALAAAGGLLRDLNLTHLPLAASAVYWLFIPAIYTMNISIVIYSITLLSQMLTEKDRMMKPLLKMMGISDFVYFSSWMCVHCAEGLASMAVYSVGLLVLGVFRNVNLLSIYIMLLSNVVGHAALMVLLTTILSNPESGVGIAATLCVLMAAPFLLFIIVRRPVHQVVILALSLLSPTAFCSSILNLFIEDQMEGRGQNERFWSFATPHSSYTWPLLAAVFIIMVDAIIYFLLALYLDKVLPKAVGKREHWLYCCNSTQPKIHRYDPADDDSELHSSSHRRFLDPDVVEPATQEERVAVRIENLSKRFDAGDGRDHWALKNFSLDIYQNQITAILGHNGAGKSTLLRILSGLMAPTFGTAYILGYDVNDPKSMDEVRKIIGVCPQENVFSSELTVKQHLEFFARIRGVRKADRNQEIRELLNRLDKENYAVGDLSGGQQRRLSIGTAIIGGPKVIFLDEPTSGVDPLSRRKLWDLLKNLRNGRTMILTTHYMDEADGLADRKALISAGMLKYAGTSRYIRDKFRIGYKLEVNLSFPGDPESHRFLDTLVSGVIPASTKSPDQSRSQVSYTLPPNTSPKFSQLFRLLDQEVNSPFESRIQNYGLSLATLEEIFLELGRQEEQAKNKGTSSPNNKRKKKWRFLGRLGAGQAPDEEPASSLAAAEQNHHGSNATTTARRSSRLRALMALLKLRFLLILKRPGVIVSIFFSPLLNLTICLLLSYLSSSSSRNISWEVIWSPASFKTQFGNTVWYKSDNPNGIQKSLDSVGIETVEFNGPFESILLHSKKSPTPLYFEENGSKLVTYFNTTMATLPPATSNLLSNMILKKAGVNEVLVTKTEALPKKLLKTRRGIPALSLVSNVMLVAGFSAMPIRLCLAIVNERELGIRTGLRMSGLGMMGYYLPYVISHWIFMALIFVILVIGIVIIPISPVADFVPLTLMCILYLTHFVNELLFAGLSASLFGKEATAGAVFPVAYNILGSYFTYIPMIMLLARSESDPKERLLYNIFNFIFAFLYPPYTNGMGIFVMGETFLKLRETKETVGFYEIVSDWLVLPLFIAVPVQMIALIYLITVKDLMNHDTPLSQALLLRPRSNKSEGIYESHVAERFEREDSDVFEERKFVRDYLTRMPAGNFDDVPLRSESSTDDQKIPAIVVKNLKKSYWGHEKLNLPFGKVERQIVRDLDFHVDQGQIFGLLGPNGAGKTTTIKLLLAENRPTGGQIFVGGEPIRNCHSEALLRLGFCPQHDALWGDLNIREHLEFYAGVRLRNWKKSDCKVFLDSALPKMNILDSEQTEAIRNISGGTKRKLSFLISIFSQPYAVLLDEPTTGMDPVSRRKLWDIIKSPLLCSDLVLDHLGSEKNDDFQLRNWKKSECKAFLDSALPKMNILDSEQTEAIRNISGGTKRKLSFLISIFSQPYAVLLDEPTTGMDPVSRRKLWDIIKSEVEGRMGAILTTHFMEEADVLCDRVGIMNRGSMRCIGTTQHLRTKYGSSYTAELWLDILKTAPGERSQLLSDFATEFPGAEFVETSVDRIIFSMELTYAAVRKSRPKLYFIAVAMIALADRSMV
ncbi:unnamed protein product [Notodromas monacha]|uniref:ABC transporter domain-containing protein n=1 Tax=Notodromas monacha TaxID=399045 RepID=A0A7R9BTS7_9CRUS|nr:unnamed protein product [Notodromas monacha]CAG0921591.1 unnamed protein product [Notodromas monacha]